MLSYASHLLLYRQNIPSSNIHFKSENAGEKGEVQKLE